MGRRRRAKPPAGIPWRGPGPERPELPLPPGRMPLLRGGRPLKHWRWVGAFGPQAMVCAAYVRVGVVPVAWWAIWDGTEMKNRTYRRGGPVKVEPGLCRAPGIDLELEEGPGIEVVSPHGSQYVYTHKQGGVPMRGTVAGLPFEGFGIIDDTAGYHARRTSWRWSAGVGVARSGARIAWNLTDGIHDDPAVSERTVWVDGEAHETGPVRFADDLSGVGGLQFTRLAARSRRENFLLLSSDYEQPFGSFSGVLPVAGALKEGWGVMERHDVRW